MGDPKTKKQTSKNFSIRLIEAWLRYQLKSNNVPGMAFGIRFREQEPILMTFGNWNVENNIAFDVNQPARVSSLSKTFTAVAILQLWERNIIKLDESIIHYLPFLENHIDERFSLITIQHLLSHTSGLKSDLTMGYWSNFNFPKNEKFIHNILKEPLIFLPGSNYKYSNLGYVLLGMIIEKLMSTPFYTYISENILNPLSCFNTWFDTQNSKINNLTFGYEKGEFSKSCKLLPRFSTNALSAAVGLITSISDIMTFLSELTSSSDSFFSSKLKMKTLELVQAGRSSRHLLGYHIQQFSGLDKIYIQSGGMPGCRAFLAFSEPTSFIFSILTNMTNTSSFYTTGILGFIQKTSNLLENILYHEDESLHRLLRKIEGYYQTNIGPVYFTSFDNNLISFLPDSKNPVNTMISYKHVGDNTFLCCEDMGFSKFGESINFKLDNEGSYILVDCDGADSPRFDLAMSYVHTD